MERTTLLLDRYRYTDHNGIELKSITLYRALAAAITPVLAFNLNYFVKKEYQDSAATFTVSHQGVLLGSLFAISLRGSGDCTQGCLKWKMWKIFLCAGIALGTLGPFLGLPREKITTKLAIAAIYTVSVATLWNFAKSSEDYSLKLGCQRSLGAFIAVFGNKMSREIPIDNVWTLAIGNTLTALGILLAFPPKEKYSKQILTLVCIGLPLITAAFAETTKEINDSTALPFLYMFGTSGLLTRIWYLSRRNLVNPEATAPLPLPGPDVVYDDPEPVPGDIQKVLV